jgi:hypothetical protein
MQEARNRRRRNTAFILRLMLFFVILVCLCILTLFLLTPKRDFGAGSMLNFYAQPKDTIDVLAVGTSMTYAGVNTNVLWANWGYSVYDLASAEQQYWNTYFYLKEALKTQHPKVILLDAKPATYQDDKTKSGRTIMSTFGILSPVTRIEAIRETAGTQWLDYVFGFPQIHSQWKQLSLDRFTAASWTGGRSSNWKGFIERDITERHDKPSLVWTSIKRNINAREEEFFFKICDLAKENGIKLLLVAYPNPDYASDHMFYNALWALADERGVPHLNLNDPEGHYKFRYSTEFADWQHLNTLGSIKLSKILGTYLQEHYDLTDHRGSDAYATWEDCLTEWKTAWPQYADKIEVEETT